MNAATTQPCKSLSSGRKKLRAMGRVFEGWSELMRLRVASQVGRIRHWKVFEMGYEDTVPFNITATYYIDPPYEKSGIYYKHSSKNINYKHLGEWCQTRRGQVIVCENEGATWLPFVPFAEIKSSQMSNKKDAGVSREVIWTGGVK